MGVGETGGGGEDTDETGFYLVEVGGRGTVSVAVLDGRSVPQVPVESPTGHSSSAESVIASECSGANDTSGSTTRIVEREVEVSDGVGPCGHGVPSGTVEDVDSGRGCRPGVSGGTQLDEGTKDGVTPGSRTGGGSRVRVGTPGGRGVSVGAGTSAYPFPAGGPTRNTCRGSSRTCSSTPETRWSSCTGGGVGVDPGDTSTRCL